LVTSAAAESEVLAVESEGGVLPAGPPQPDRPMITIAEKQNKQA
jgi:hypothetical protein